MSTSELARQGVGAGGSLLEREAELATVGDGLDRLQEGRSRLILLRGPAGIGKTGLLDAIRAHAASRGIRVLSARGAEIEAGVGFGLARQLLEGPLRSAKGSERRRLLDAAGPAAAQLGVGDADTAPRGSDPVGALVHSFYWLIAALAEEGLVIVVDDLQWADPPSIRLLAHTARRLEGLPLMLCLAARTDVREGDEDPWHEFAAAGAGVLEPEPLSPSAVGELASRRLGEEVDDRFAEACHEVTGGNPFLAGELLAELARERVMPSAESIPVVRSVGPKGVARSVLVRIAALGSQAAQLARAVAVLGEDVAIRHAAAVAGLKPSEAAAAAAALARAAIFADRMPLAFAHPVLRAAVEADMPAPSRALLHAHSAGVLREDGVESDLIAAHILATEPGLVEGAREVLVKAAESALERGVPAEAVRFLSRCRREPGPDEAAVRRLLGIALLRAGDAAGIEHLEAVMSAGDPDERALAARPLAIALISRGENARAVAALERALEGIEDRELELRLEAELVAIASLDPETARMAAARLSGRADVRGDTSAERLLLAHVARQLATSGAGAEAAAEAAGRALGGGALVAEETADAPAIYHAVLVLLSADRYDEAEKVLALAVEDAQRRRSLFGFAMASSFQAACAFRRGDVGRTEADARASIDSMRDAGIPMPMPSALSHLMDALMERGDIAGARRELEAHGWAETIPTGFLFQPVLDSRGRLRLAEGDHAGALEDIAEAHRRSLNPVRGTGGTTFRSWAAPALAALGRPEEAARRADEELEIARAWGGRRTTGMALRAKGLVTPGDDGIRFLEQSVAVLDGSGVQLELARSLTALGAAIRHAGRRTESRDPLRRGLSLAEECGSTVLAERAREELRLAGARPRRAAISGTASLTPSERRIAERAASGKTNRQIAQELFLTMKTVAFHLTNAYRKLDVSSREELAAALSDSD